MVMVFDLDSDEGFDRAVLVESSAEFAELEADPEAFLRKVGAMDGLKSFNGVDKNKASGPTILCCHMKSCKWKYCNPRPN
jgi:hypothetical protein